jgi:hypothetical protein
LLSLQRTGSIIVGRNDNFSGGYGVKCFYSDTIQAGQPQGDICAWPLEWDGDDE